MSRSRQHPKNMRAPTRALSPRLQEHRRDSVFRHAQNRALARYGVLLERDVYEQWQVDIRKGLAREVGPARRGGHVWAVQLAALTLYAVVREDLIRTFLPPTAPELVNEPDPLLLAACGLLD